MGSSILQLLGRQQLEQAQGTAQTPAGRLNTTVALSDGMDVRSVSEAEQLARTLNIPVAQVMGNIASARASALRQRSEELARNAPIATNWVASSPERASLSRNDLENLGFFERLFGSPGVDQATGRKSVLMPRGTTPLPPRNQGLLGAEWDRAALNGELGRLQFDLSPAQRQLPENQQRIRALKDKIAAYQLPESRGAAETALRSAATILPSLVSGTAAGGIASGIGAGAALVVGAPVAPVAGVAFTAGMLARGIREQAGGDIDRNLSVPGADPVVADRAGRISGLVSGSIEAVATRLFLKPFAALLPKAAPAAASKILAQPTTRAAVLNGVKAWGGAVAAETGTEVAQQAISLASEQYVRQASGAPSIEGGRVVEELVETAITTAAGMALLGVPGGVVTTVNDLGKIEQAKDNQRFLSALGDLSTESDLRKNSTDEFRSFIEDQVANYGPVRDISVPVERFNAYWQERNVDPRIIAAEVLRDITGYDQAVASGGDVVIPLADYVAKIAPTEHHAGLVEDIRLRPGDLTAREAKEQEAQVTADLEGLSKELSSVAEESAADVDAMRVIEDVTAKIEATGVYTADQVAAMARSIASPYIVLGRRSGQSPWQVYSNRNISLLAPVQAERLYDAIAEMEGELAKDPTSPAAIAAIQNVNTLRGEIEQLPGGAAIAERALTPLVMPISTVDVGQRVVLADGRSAVVEGRAESKVGPAAQKRIAKLKSRIENLEAVIDRQQYPVAGTPEAEGAPLTIFKRLSPEEFAKAKQDVAQAKREIKELRRGANISVRVSGQLETVGPDIEVQVPGEVLRQARIVFAEQPPVPESVGAVSNVEAAFNFAGSQQFARNRDFKVALQDLINSAAKEAGVDLTQFAPEVEQYLVRMGVADARTALRTNANAVGWYNEKVTKALRVMSLVHPELATDLNARFSFIWAMAVTSNGLKVDKNFELANDVYVQFKRDGVMPTKVGIGTAAGAINESLRLYNKLIEQYGIAKTVDFFTSMHTVKEVKEFTGKNISGENLTTQAYGAAALGPKIGNGFFMNLYGKFEQLTMDRWFMRTWGRWTGTLIIDYSKNAKVKRSQLAGLIELLTDAERSELEQLIKVDLATATMDEVGNAIQKASMSKAVRTKISLIRPILGDARIEEQLNTLLGKVKGDDERAGVGDEVRKAGNALAKYLDGQKEAPSGAPERGRIRQVMNQVLSVLQAEFPALTMADLQALLWYPEKRLYDAAKTSDEEAMVGYEDDDAPDYANAAVKLAVAQNIPQDRINNVITEVDNELRAAAVPAADVVAGRAERGAGDGVSGMAAPQRPADSGRVGLQVLRQSVTPSDASVARLLDRAMDPSYAYEVLPEKIDVDGVMRPTRNSWGQQITPTAKSMRAFWRWFGYSTIVDKWGRPRMMYHGTVADVDFDTFRLNPLEMGVHVGNPNQAVDRVQQLSGGEPGGEVAGPRVLKLYARAFNPLRLIDEGGFVPRRNVIPQLVDLGILSTEQAFALQQLAEKKTNESYAQVYDAVIGAIRVAGYDSIVYVNRIEGLHISEINAAVADNYTVEQRKNDTDAEFMARFPSAGDSYIVFAKQQLKSPANVGTFSSRIASTMRQETGDRPNAFIIPGVRRTTIGLMKTANLSSLFHEFAHDYLNLLFDVAASPEATEQIKADAALVLETFGVADKMDLTVEHQERWARMFESYIEEGKAPTRAMDRAFARFRAWMTAIYRTARNVLVPVSPEIRGVFDRMLATDEEIAATLQQNESQPLFESATEANMTDAEFAAYQQAVADRDEYASAMLLKQLLAERNKERRQIWRDREAEVIKTTTEQVDLEPVQQVVYFLKTGKLLSGDELPEGVVPLKLSKALLLARYGDEVLKALPRGVYSVEGGIDPDVLALSFGFSSGDAMVTQMQAYEPRDQRIKRIVKETMAREFPDLLNDSPALADAAQSAVHRSPTDQLLYDELVKLGRSDAMIPPVNLRAVRQAAKELVAKTRLRDLSPERFRLAEAKAGRLAYAAMRRGDKVQAAFHKRQQLLNHILHREAASAVEMSDRALKFFGKMSKTPAREKLGKAGQEFLEQMDALLEQYQFARVSGRELDRRMALSEWVAAQLARGIPVEVPVDVLYNMREINYRLLTAEQLQGVYDTGRQIYHIARMQNKLLAEARQRSLEQVRDAVVASIAEHHTIEPRQPDYAPSKLKAAANFLKKIDAWHVKPEFLFRWLDGDKVTGAVWDALFKPIADAENAESTMVIDASRRIEALFDMISSARRKEFLSRTIAVPGVDTKITGATAVSMALNWGNIGNREALLESTINGEPVWTRAQVDVILKTLTKDEWMFVQSVWNYINEFWPQIAELQRELTGVTPEKVEAEPFEVTLADGEVLKLQGGYYPLKYDQEYSWAQWKQDEAANVQELGGNPYIRAATRHGFTEARVGSGGRPVKLDLSVFSEHVLNVIHDLTHRKAIMDVQRVAELPEVRTAIEGTAGRELYRTIRPWLLRIAGDRRPAASPIEDLLGRARTGVTVVNMGFKVTTAIVQPLGYLQTVDLLGPAYARRGLTAFFANPAKTWRAASEQSVALRTRQQSFDRDVRDQTKRLLKKGPLAKAQESFFYFTAMADMAVAVPTWYGAYLKSLEVLKPGDQHAAVTYADSVVRMSQGSGAAKDLAQIQGGSELARSFTLFYTYFSALYNLLRRSGALLKDRGPRDVPRFLGSMAALWLVPAVLSELISGRGPEDDEDAMQWALWRLVRFPFSTVVGARDIASAIGPDAYDYELSPLVDAGESVVKTLNAVGAAAGEAARGEGFYLTEGEVKEFMMAVGIWAQLPSRQMYITGSYLYDWMMGYEEPEQPAEVFQGLAFPRQK